MLLLPFLCLSLDSLLPHFFQSIILLFFGLWIPFISNESIIPSSFSSSSSFPTSLDAGCLRCILKSRLHHLSKPIKRLPKLSSCNTSAYIVITDEAYGNTGNNIIEFTHGLWLSQIYHYTFVVPSWIHPALIPFNLTLLHERFCFTLDEKIPMNSTKLEIIAGDLFFVYGLFVDKRYNQSMPTYDNTILPQISTHFITIYSALWSSISHHIVNATAWLIEQKLESSFQYTTVHKRSLEGTCNKIFNARSKPSDFDPNQIDRNHSSWYGNLGYYHPICEMPLSFVQQTMRLHNKSRDKIFLAYDGRGSIQEYKTMGAIMNSDLDSTLFHEKIIPNHARKYIDMFVAMNGDLFLLNPYSTFSFQIQVIRICFELKSIPIMSERDVYFYEKKDSPTGDLWVSVTSIEYAYLKLKPLFDES